MTEEEWHSLRSLGDAFELWWNHPSARKLRLVSVACCRRVAHLGDDETQSLVELGGLYADGLVDRAKIQTVHASLRPTSYDAAGETYRAAMWCLGLCPASRSVLEVASAARDAIRASEGKMPIGEDEEPGSEDAAQVALLRDIFGNPFRPVVLDPAWLTSDVLALACGIYEDRAFDRMPILADALQDAGCDNDDILNHCRDANQVHARGCWVVDLLLGKE